VDEGDRRSRVGVVGQLKRAVSTGFATEMDIESFWEDVLRLAPELRGASFAPRRRGPRGLRAYPAARRPGPDHIPFSAEEGRITGIIDWGDASIGDPDYELSYLYRAGGARFVEEVVRHGPRRDRAKLERKLRFYAGHDTIDTILNGLERGDAPLVAAGLMALREQAASGRPP